MGAPVMIPAMHHWIRGLAIVLACLSIGLAVSHTNANGEPKDVLTSGDELAVLDATPTVATLPQLFAARGKPGVSIEGSGLSDGADGPPEMIGIAGRLPDDVEVLIRLPDRTTNTLRLGQSAGGWTLVSATVDRAVFERAGARSVVLLQAP